eukprot:TRINITY_DN15537_c0_g1_i1.p1 TRINITY_DN15537_c0_g1~~TRINITY_DN15537_c0_g1_i1.p1  ORF type:complete len:308 (+),score=52.06 TRINITY_DN15537_c0_g1_i1:171-1094(+)
MIRGRMFWILLLLVAFGLSLQYVTWTGWDVSDRLMKYVSVSTTEGGVKVKKPDDYFYYHEEVSVWSDDDYGVNASALPMTNKRSALAPKVCVVVRATEKQQRTLLQLIHSLLSSHYRNLKIVVVDTITDIRLPYLDLIETIVNDPKLEISPRMRRLQPNENSTDIPLKENSSGYVDSNEELERLLEEGWCEYFVWTNGDNVYDYDFLDSMLDMMVLEKQLVLVKFVTHHMGYIKRYDHFQDLGCGLVSRDVLTRYNIRFQPYDLQPGRNIPWHDSDYYFFATIKDRLHGAGQIVLLEESPELHLWHM